MKVETCMVMLNDYAKETSQIAVCDVIEQDGKLLLVAIWNEMADGSRVPAKTIELDRRYVQPLGGAYPAKWFYRKPMLDPRAQISTQ